MCLALTHTPQLPRGRCPRHTRRVRRVSPAPLRAHAAVPIGPGAPRDLPGARPRGAHRWGRRGALRGARVPPLSGMRHSGPRLGLCPVRGVRARFSDRLFLQRPRGMPRLQRPAHGRDARASGRSGLRPAAATPMGAVGPEALALLPATRSRGARRGAAYPVARHRGAAGSAQRLRARAAGGRELRPAGGWGP
jgi:hypothetical protein